jgi:hypothetical protein
MTSGRQRDRTALAISIALHVCAWTLLALALRSTFPPPMPEDRITIARLLQVDRLPPAKPAPLPQGPPLPPPPPQPTLHLAVAHLPRRPIVTDAPRYAARRAAPDAAVSALAGAPAAADDLPAAAPSSTPSPVAAPVAPSTRADPATIAGGGSNSEGIGNFGESYAAALAPEARATLVAGIASGFVVLVKVDENGHATEVAFLHGPDDPAMRELIRQRLLAARFIHAVSNGLPAPGTVELRT